ncbi:DUF305 domain-containing protein [Streptomyces sp. NPDC006739]|uniref:DUF305 domain-containing protein n=1 Tax=Streptomyces sp. NPDC006739 TaxID=3364763 RepID=UPI00369ADE27
MRNTRTVTRRAALAATTAAAALVLAACGGGSSDNAGGGHEAHGSVPSTSSAGTAAGAHNAQDVSFAQGMIPHHRQALEMAGLAAKRASSAQVKDLAARIEKAQGPEIRTMTGWLKSWNERVPAAGGSMDSMPGMDHSSPSSPSSPSSAPATPGMNGMTGMTGMTGMMDPGDMDKLEKASGKEFDTMFLTMMIEHHQGAVEMATTEKSKGRYQPATALSDAIITGQTAEIAEMNKLLGKG